MPPAAPARCADTTWQAFAQQLAAARAAGSYIALGDWNSKLGADAAGEADWGTAAEAATGRASAPRSLPPDAHPTCPYGARLTQACLQHDGLVLTGRVYKDIPARNTSFPRTGMGRPARLDHVIASTDLFPRALVHPTADRVQPCDHSLLKAVFHFPTKPARPTAAVGAPAPPAAAPAAAAGGPPRWRQRREAAYIHALSGRIPAASAAAAASALDPDAASHIILDLITSAAVAAGMGPPAHPHHSPPRPPRRPPGRGGRPQPWFDADCRRARDHLRRFASLFPRASLTRELRAHFRRLVHHKKAAHEHPRAAAWLHRLKHYPRTFWLRILSKRSCIPPALDDGPAAAEHYAAAFAPPPPPNPRAITRLPHLAGGRFGSDEQAAELADDFTAEAVEAQIAKLKVGTAAGPAGLAVEFIKHARIYDRDNRTWVYLLAPLLASFFTNCMRVGRVPHSWQTSLITPVPKPGGDRASLAGFRPIAVSSVLPKLYARVLNARLVQWAEAHDKHVPEQAGFRPGMGTQHHLFALRHVYDVIRHDNPPPPPPPPDPPPDPPAPPPSRPAFLAFVDLKQAYDRVSRPLLWAALDFLGVRGPFLHAIQALYADVRMAVRLPSGLSPSFPCHRGLRQGCPLSPTLFTLLFDHLADYLNRPLPDGLLPHPPCDPGFPIPGLSHPLRALFFADDVVLLARSRAGLQTLLDRLHLFCETWQLEVNVAKTKAMVVDGRPAPAPPPAPVTVGGQALAWVDAYKYLGMHFTSPGGFKDAGEDAVARVRAAIGKLWGIMAHHDELQAHLGFGLRLFDTLVLTGGDYGSHVWALPAAVPRHDALPIHLPVQKTAVEDLHGAFLRRHLRAPPASMAADPVVYREAGHRPWAVRWGLAAVRFWNGAVTVARTPSHLIPWLLDANIALAGSFPTTATSTDTTHRCWSAEFFDMLRGLWPLHTSSVRAAVAYRCTIPKATVDAAFKQWHDRGWEQLGDPRLPETAHRQLATYKALHFIDDKRIARRQTYIHDPSIPIRVQRRTAALRLGLRSLPVNQRSRKVAAPAGAAAAVPPAPTAAQPPSPPPSGPPSHSSPSTPSSSSSSSSSSLSPSPPSSPRPTIPAFRANAPPLAAFAALWAWKEARLARRRQRKLAARATRATLPPTKTIRKQPRPPTTLRAPRRAAPAAAARRAAPPPPPRPSPPKTLITVKIPFAARLCTACPMGAIGDARHLLFECTAPKLVAVRERFRRLLDQGPDPVASPYDAARTIANGDQATMAQLFSALVASAGLATTGVAVAGGGGGGGGGAGRGAGRGRGRSGGSGTGRGAGRGAGRGRGRGRPALTSSSEESEESEGSEESTVGEEAEAGSASSSASDAAGVSPAALLELLAPPAAAVGFAAALAWRQRIDEAARAKMATWEAEKAAEAAAAAVAAADATAAAAAAAPAAPRRRSARLRGRRP